MHPACRAYLSRTIASHGPFQRVVEFGAKDINGSARPLFGDCGYVGVDLLAGPGVDVVADAAAYRPDEAPDCVVCVNTLEHAPNAAAVVANAAAILAPGGCFILTAPTDPWPPHSGIDGGRLRAGEHYRNLDPDETRALLAELFADVCVEHVARPGELYACCWKGAA